MPKYIKVVSLVIIGLVLLGLVFRPGQNMVAGLFKTQPSLDEQAIEEILQNTKSIDATTLVGKPGLYYLEASNLVGVIATARYSAYDDLVEEGKIPAGAKISTDQDEQPSSSPSSPSTSQLGTTNSDSLLLTINGSTITGSVVQSGLKTSLMINDAGFLKSLVGLSTSQLDEGTNLYWTLARFNAALASVSTSDLAEGTNLYWTSARFNTALGSASLNTSQITAGSLAISRGGTGGSASPTQGGVAYGTGTAYAFTAAGTAGQCLVSAGTAAPHWSSCSTGSITGTGSAGQLAFFNSNDTLTGSSALTWDDDSKVLTVAGDIVPDVNITRSLGSPTLYWKDVYIGPGSLYINGQKVLEEGADSIIVSADPNQDLVMQTSGSGDIELGAAGTGLIQLKSNILLTGGKNISTTDNSAVAFADGLAGGNLQLSGNVLQASNLNGGISITPAGNGGTYITNGNVGVGNTDPQAKLDVTGTFRASGQATLSNYATNGGLLFTNSSGLLSQLGAGTTGQCLTSNTGAAASWSNCAPANNVTGSGAAGQVAFWDGTNSTTGSSTFAWSNANTRLSLGSSVAQTGTIAMANGAGINWRNQGNSGDIVGLQLSNGNFSLSNGAIQGTTPGGTNTLYVQGNNGNVGIGQTTPTAKLEVVSAGTTTHGTQITANALTTGRGLNISSTSTALTTGGLIGLSWTPGTATSMTGDLFSLNVGPNGTVGSLMNLMNDGISVFKVTQSQITASVPVAFMAAGDMSLAYDLMFDNSTSGNIKSAGPLRIQSGETFNSSDLTLGTYNNGVIMFDSGIVSTANNTKLGLGGVYAPTARLALAAGTTAADGIAFGTDTNLYRSAADTLKTDDLLVVGSLKIGNGAALTAMYSATTVWDPAEIAGGGSDYTTLTVTGATVGDIVTASFTQVITDGLVMTAQVSAADTVRVTLSNATADPIDLSSGTIRVQVNKF